MAKHSVDRVYLNSVFSQHMHDKPAVMSTTCALLAQNKCVLGLTLCSQNLP